MILITWPKDHIKQICSKKYNEVFYLIIPDNREKDVRLQLSRPAIKQNNVTIKYILFSELRTHCDALCKFGDSHMIMEKIAKIA